ncbi:MAG TPA: hypothetical protein VHC97_14010 [Thermoanaerobaculia bacterium]|jgi:hypothetical protein|nr:hypothetical protein [Thermoanaerobaculia bacterium]
MRAWTSSRYGALVVALAIGVAAQASATTLMRAGLDELTTGNSTIVVGKVLDAHSYWNKDGTFILTDVRVAVHEVLKGQVKGGELTLTIMGGTVGDLTTLIVGGAELRPESSYVLFLGERNLPGVREKALTISDHCQGAFDLVLVGEGLRAVSQANRHPLVPDRQGFSEPPGGVEGLALDSMVRSIRNLTRTSREVR